MMKEYDVVHVARLDTVDRAYEGTEGVCRPPRVGDVAKICHEYEPWNPRAMVAVECVDESGCTLWLADFSRDELELVPASGGMDRSEQPLEDGT